MANTSTIEENGKIENQKKLILMGVGVFVIVLFAFALNNSVMFNRLYSDFFLRWYAVTKLFSEGRNLYDPQNAEEMWKIAYGHNPWGYETNFFYPAHILIFVAPLALRPYKTAHLIWTIVVQLFYFASLLLAMRSAKWPTNSTAAGIFIALNFVSLPYIFHTIWGQFNTIAMIGLMGCYLALREDRYALAGAWAVSLTFKPQNDMLVLVFLLFWALWNKKRWPFLLSFGIASLFCWLFAELLQPGWVTAFLNSLGHYTSIQSAVDQLWNPGHITSIGLVLFSLGIFFWKRNIPVKSTAFIACLTLSIAVWDLIIPIFGWIHSVLLVLAIVWLIPLWKKQLPVYENYPGYVFIFLYGFGWLGFFLSLITGGGQLAWVEIAYKILFPLCILAFSIPLLWRKDLDLEDSP